VRVALRLAAAPQPATKACSDQQTSACPRARVTYDHPRSPLFTGQLYARQRSLLTLLQRDASTGYTAAHVAVAAFDDSGWTGTWGDVTGPQVETFAMTSWTERSDPA
jgi:hypothetical protein